MEKKSCGNIFGPRASLASRRKGKGRDGGLTRRQSLFLRQALMFVCGFLTCYLFTGGADIFERWRYVYTLPQAQVIGIDISHHQGEVDWDRLCFSMDAMRRTDASGNNFRRVDFVIAKATEGASHTDRKYASYKSGCRRKGIPFGAYHYYKPSAAPDEQAASFVRTAALSRGDMVPVLDVEECGRKTAAQLRADVLEWLDRVERECGVRPMVYCNLDYYRKYFDTPAFGRYRFWIAAYRRKTLGVEHLLWQQTDRGRMRGIKGRVDIDVFNGDRADFERTMIIH